MDGWMQKKLLLSDLRDSPNDTSEISEYLCFASRLPGCLPENKYNFKFQPSKRLLAEAPATRASHNCTQQSVGRRDRHPQIHSVTRQGTFSRAQSHPPTPFKNIQHATRTHTHRQADAPLGTQVLRLRKVFPPKLPRFAGPSFSSHVIPRNRV